MSSDPGWSSAVSAWLFSSSWWPLLPFIMLLVVAAFVVAFVLLLYMISPLISPKPLKLNGAHVVVRKLKLTSNFFLRKKRLGYIFIPVSVSDS